MSQIKYTELDFFLIKENLKNFLKSQDKFKDYNFDGSSLSILLDILAYNTGYNAFYLNMVANEMFLDSASLRESVNSRAKHLGYTPRSASCLRAVVDFEVFFQNPAPNPPSNLVLSKNQQFYTNYNDSRYTFYPIKDIFFEKIATNTYIARNVELVEGKRFTHSYTVDTNSAIPQRYVIPNSGADSSTILVTVKESSTSTNVRAFLRASDINEVKSTDNVYFLQPYEDTLYEIIFGDGIVGTALQNGNIVNIEYIVATGEEAAGASSFKTGKLINLNIAGNQVPTFTTKIPAGGYSDIEDIDSIKFLAPLSYQAQNRAVTKIDYETLLLRDVSNIEYIRVWGGEENNPPEYGKVFCSIKPKTGLTLNSEEKNRILTTFVRPRSLVSTEVVITDPEYIGIDISTKVNYFSDKTILSADSIRALVYGAIDLYKNENLKGFDSDFRFSKFTSYIDNADPSIESNITEIKIKYNVIPTLNSINKFSILLNNEIDTGDNLNSLYSITSSEFYYNNLLVSLADDGKGNIYVYYTSSSGISSSIRKVGSVNYSTGTIQIENLLVSSIPNNKNAIQFSILPKYNDIIALRNQFILIEPSEAKVDIIDLSRIKLS